MAKFLNYEDRLKGAHDFHRAWRETGKGQDYHHKGDQELFHRKRTISSTLTNICRSHG